MATTASLVGLDLSSILMLLLQCLAQQILISVVLRMQWFLEAQESHVPVMEHGALRLLYVSVDLDMRKYSHSVLVSNSDTHMTCYKSLLLSQHVKQVNIVPVKSSPASNVLTTQRHARKLLLNASV